MDRTRERRTAILLSLRTERRGDREELTALLAEPLDWDYLFHTLTRHKTVFIAWENLCRRDLIQPAAKTSGFVDFWHVYYWQLHFANRKRSEIYLENAARVLGELEKSGVACAAIKGGAVIGDLYSPGERFLHDIDFLISRGDATRCAEVMQALGYQHGVYRYATGTIDPMDRRMQRAWVFQMHNLPSFYKISIVEWVPYLKFQAGWDFFDTFEDYSVPSDDVIARRVPKGDGSGIYVPDRGDQFLNACAHIFREGVSTVYHDYRMNWQISKLVDLVELIHVIGRSDGGWPEVIDDRVKQYALAEPVGYALACCQKLIGGEVLDEWARRFPVDEAILAELRDGRRRYTVSESLTDRVFAEGRISPDARGGWSRQFAKDEY